jgi:hypothetical protein
MEIDAPADVSHDLVSLRETLDVATQAFFHCEAGDDSSAESLQRKLAAFLHTDRSKRDIDSPAPDGIYGANLTVQIEPAKAFPNSVFVVLTFGIECGNDNLLFLYTKEDDVWVQRLHWYSDKYTKPSDAFGGAFAHNAVPGPNADQPLIAVVHGHPWCTSVHSGFSLDLVRPSMKSSPQQAMDHVTHSYVIDDEFRVAPTRSGLQIRTTVESEDTGRIFHSGVLSYSTNTGKLILLPVALNARDFVDEWLEELWPTSERWSEPDAVSSLRPIHDRFDYSLHENGRDIQSITFGPVRGCKPGSNRFQVEIDSDDGPLMYAQVRQNPNSFTMLAITDKPSPSCTGPDIMKKR